MGTLGNEVGQEEVRNPAGRKSMIMHIKSGLIGPQTQTSAYIADSNPVLLGDWRAAVRN